jgi:hypothetical protein
MEMTEGRTASDRSRGSDQGDYQDRRRLAMS